MVFHSLDHQHQQHHATTQNTSKQLAQCNFHHVCSCMDPVLFSNMLKETRTDVQWVMLAKAFPRLVGRVKLVWTLSEFWWWKVQLEYGYVWMVWFHHSLHHSLHHQHHQHHATTHNTNNNLCNDIFPMFVLAWVLFWFTTCWKKQVQWIMLAKAFERLVGTVKLVWTFC